MKVAHFDCPSGASGNMILGALLDAGLEAAGLEAELRKLDLPAWTLEQERVRKGPIAALQVDFAVPDRPGGHTERSYGEIDALIATSDLAATPKARARAMFRRLAEAEAAVHGVPVAEVHFHEVGAVDSILDIVGVAVAVDLLGIGEAGVSRINVGGGTVRTQHGVLPVPAPATVRLLEGTGAEIYSTTEEAELLTPTGALVLTSLATAYGPSPAMRVVAHGYGAGHADLSTPNVLRATLGERDDRGGFESDHAAVVETNIDDMNPEFYAYVADRLWAAGALDVATTPISMKKGRPGTQLSVIVEPSNLDAVAEVLLTETTTLGVRTYDVRRLKLTRQQFVVGTHYGPIGVKAAYMHGRLRDVAPEAEDCRRAAEAHQVPLRTVYDAARAAGLDQAADQSDRPESG